jgi:hypothetical protein
VIDDVFTQNVALVAITAGLTGLLVPTVKAIMDQRHFKEQKRYEAELARQSSIIAAQVALLEKAVEDYEDKSGSRFGHMQAEFSKARRLVSADRYDELQALYSTFLELDVSLLRLQQSNASQSEWREHHRRAFSTQGSVSEALARMAEEMRLAAVPS